MEMKGKMEIGDASSSSTRDCARIASGFNTRTTCWIDATSKPDRQPNSASGVHRAEFRSEIARDALSLTLSVLFLFHRDYPR